jgi:hypothetical protein
MRFVSIGLFAVIVMFGIIRICLPGELTAERAKIKIQTLDSVQKQMGDLSDQPSSPRMTKFSSAITSQKQDAEQVNKGAQQNIAVFNIFQITLTILAIGLTAIVIRLLLLGRQVDTVVKTFTFGSMTTIVGFWFYIAKQ